MTSHFERLFTQARSALDQEGALAESCLLQFYAILSIGLRGNCANHTVVSRLCAFDVFLICAGNSTEIPAFLKYLYLAIFWMKEMLGVLLLNIAVLQALRDAQEKHENSQCLSASYLFPVLGH